MKIRLKNIGIIKDSEIVLDGLTVITGKNNSGKTTVGKTLYSLLDGVSNIQQKAQNDKAYYIRRQLNKVSNTLPDFLRCFRLQRPENAEFFSSYPALKELAFRKTYQERSLDENMRLARGLEEELSLFEGELIERNSECFQYWSVLRGSSNEQEHESRSSIFNAQKEEALWILHKMFADVEKDPQLIDYARESINQTLQTEFSYQIQPVRGQQGDSKIELLGENTAYFHLTISENRVVNEGVPVFVSVPYQKAYFVDDPFVLDNALSWRFSDKMEPDDDAILNPNRIVHHNYKLNSVLRSRRQPSVFEQTILSDTLQEIKEKIDEIIPGTFDFSPEGEYYIQNGMKLRIANLAAGSKMFSIIKILLAKGELDNTTMLILDEPETHLHPQWQNAFAEIIVLLVKELGINILLTTHSSNFMLALDAYMRKYHIADKTNFYQTDMLEDGFVRYRCVNDDMGKIYEDFLQYLSEVKVLRDQYLNGIGE